MGKLVEIDVRKLWGPVLVIWLLALWGCSNDAGPRGDEAIAAELPRSARGSAGFGGGMPGEEGTAEELDPNFRAEIGDVIKDGSGRCQVTVLFDQAEGRRFEVQVQEAGGGALLAKEEFTDLPGSGVTRWVAFDYSGALRNLDVKVIEQPGGAVVDRWGQ